jgi:hypothetical protein
MAEAEHIDLNERYSSLEEERDDKTRYGASVSASET